MLKVREIMTADVLMLNPETSLRDAAEMLAAQHVSGAPVVEGRRVVGVLSASDLLSFLASTPGVPSEREDADQGEWGEPAPETDEGVEAPGAFFTDMWDDAGADATVRFAESASPEWDVLSDHTVAEAMSRLAFSVPPGADIERAASYMRSAGVHRLLVVEDGALVGIVSSMDLARAIAERRVARRVYTFNRERDFDDRGWE